MLVVSGSCGMVGVLYSEFRLLLGLWVVWWFRGGWVTWPGDSRSRLLLSCLVLSGGLVVYGWLFALSWYLTIYGCFGFCCCVFVCFASGCCLVWWLGCGYGFCAVGAGWFALISRIVVVVRCEVVLVETRWLRFGLDVACGWLIALMYWCYVFRCFCWCLLCCVGWCLGFWCLV